MIAKIRLVLVCVAYLVAWRTAAAQSVKSASQPYRDRSSFGVFAEYSNDSSHILMGGEENRKLGGVGIDYTHRLLTSRLLDWSWMVEVRPLLMEEDPTLIQMNTATPPTPLDPNSTTEFTLERRSDCIPRTFTVTSGPHIETIAIACSARWTYTGGASPIGQRINFRPGKRLQPFGVGNAGFMIAPYDIPANNSSWFNFTWETGVGVEWYEGAHRSWSAELRYHHFSNKELGNVNPGVDNLLYKVTYRFGR
jgi:hypothetical protein